MFLEVGAIVHYVPSLLFLNTFPAAFIIVVLVIRHRRNTRRKAAFVEDYMNARRPSDNQQGMVTVMRIHEVRKS